LAVLVAGCPRPTDGKRAEITSLTMGPGKTAVSDPFSSGNTIDLTVPGSTDPSNPIAVELSALGGVTVSLSQGTGILNKTVDNDDPADVEDDSIPKQFFS
jgi:hypothetical protein